jgi:hypothetical protein
LSETAPLPFCFLSFTNRGVHMLSSFLRIETPRAICCSIFKQLAIYSPAHCVWVFTGSRMATMWANMALAPTNGYSLLTHCRTVDIPTIVPEALKQHAWAVLQTQYAPKHLPEELYDMSPLHHAGVAFMCAEWNLYYQPATETVQEFCLRTVQAKIYIEVRF